MHILGDEKKSKFGHKYCTVFWGSTSEDALIFGKLRETEGVFKTTLEKQDNKTLDLMAALDAWEEIEDYCRSDALNTSCTEARKTRLKAEAASRRVNETLTSYIKDLSMVHFYFKELGVVKYSRDELYGIMDVIGE